MSTLPGASALAESAGGGSLRAVLPLRDEQGRESRLELYSTFLKLAPLLLLKLVAKSGFGPSEQDKDRRGRVAFAGDVVLMVSAVVGGFIATLVLGDVLPETAATRRVLVVAGCLSLLVLAEYMLRQIASLYRARPRARELEGASGGTPACRGESS
jgi:hypothetical protein